ncbi:MAG: hypothetical protein ACRDPO_39035, partial [Streptosporangiaceae bacterium]
MDQNASADLALAASPPVASGSLADLPARLQALDVPGKLGCSRHRDALRDSHMIERCCEVRQGRRDNPLCLADAEGIPSLGFAYKMPGADAPMVEASINGEGKVVADPVLLEGNQSGPLLLCGVLV